VGDVQFEISKEVTAYQALNTVHDANPTEDPTQEFPPEIWYVERKALVTQEVVEFELASPLDFADVKLPRRQIIANQCPWVYRGAYCNYVGPPVATELDEPTSDPSLDKCGKRIASCKLRLWPDGVLNFGGFPAAGLMRT
jgi:lambda family phage minor tail protein L